MYMPKVEDLTPKRIFTALLPPTFLGFGDAFYDIAILAT